MSKEMREKKTCGDCIHAIICKKVNGGWFSPKNIAYCGAFKAETDNNVGGKWIPVTERLPDMDGKYLVFEQGVFGTNTRALSFATDGRKVDEYDFHSEWKNVWYYYDSEWGHITIDRVTHWMPLPEPPKGE